MKHKLAVFVIIGLFPVVIVDTYYTLRMTGPVLKIGKEAVVDLKAGSEVTVEYRTAQKSDLLIPEHPAVDTWIRWFCDEHHSGFQTQLDRSRLHAEPAQTTFMRKGLPKELVYIASLSRNRPAQKLGMLESFPEHIKSSHL